MPDKKNEVTVVTNRDDTVTLNADKFFATEHGHLGVSLADVPVALFSRGEWSYTTVGPLD